MTGAPEASCGTASSRIGDEKTVSRLHIPILPQSEFSPAIGDNTEPERSGAGGATGKDGCDASDGASPVNGETEEEDVTLPTCGAIFAGDFFKSVRKGLPGSR